MLQCIRQSLKALSTARLCVKGYSSCATSNSHCAVNTNILAYICPAAHVPHHNIVYSLPPSVLYQQQPQYLPSAYVEEEKTDPLLELLGEKQLPAGYDTSDIAARGVPRWMWVGVNNGPYGIMKIRRLKMKKHKRKKSLKRNFFLFKARDERKAKRQEKRLQEHLYGILTKGYEFDAEEYVRLQLDMYNMEKERQSGPMIEAFHVVPDNMVYPWPNPFCKRDPLNVTASDQKLAEVLKKRDASKIFIAKRVLKSK